VFVPGESDAACSPSEGRPGLRVRVGISYDFDDDIAPELLDAVSLNPALEFVCGRGDVASPIEETVNGMKVGERRSIALNESNPLFGSYDTSRRITVPASQFSEAQVGSIVSTAGPGAGMGVVIKKKGAKLLVDQNHPLAGKSVNITLTLLRCENVPPRDVSVESLVEGDGKTFPIYGDRLSLHYELSLADSGTVIEASDTQTPHQYHLGFNQADFVPGFEIGIQQMSLGELATIRVPSQLAYGYGGSKKGIPAHADIVYKVQLLSIRSELELAF